MAIGRVPGTALLPDLDRQGLDLGFTTSGNALLYLDFASFNVGVNTSDPAEQLTINGNVLIANGGVKASANISSDIGEVNSWFNNLYINEIFGTSATFAGNVIVEGSLGNIVVESIQIDGNLVLSGNTVGGIIRADEIYDSNNRVITENTNIVVTGDITGYGDYSNIALTLLDTGVIAGIYGSADDEYTDRIPKITVDSKGRITNIANVTLTQVGNVTFSNTTISSNTAITFETLGNIVEFSGATIANIADPVNPQDAVSLSYLDAELTATFSAITLNDTSVQVHDSGTEANVAFTINGYEALSIGEWWADFYIFANIANISIGENNTISTVSGAEGNIYFDPVGTVQILGTNALGIPSGTDSERPAGPVVGYIRFNTDLDALEWWTGTEWGSSINQFMTSTIITPDGISNTYTLSANVDSSYQLLVSINGTMQEPETSYTISSGNQIVFAEIPLTTDSIVARGLASGVATVTSDASLTAGNILAGNTSIVPNVDGTINITNYGTEYTRIDIDGAITTRRPNVTVVSSGVATTIDTYNADTYRTAKYLVQATTSSTVESYEVLVTHNSSNAFVTTYGVINDGNTLGAISATVSGSNIQVQYTAITANTNVRLSKNYLIV